MPALISLGLTLLALAVFYKAIVLRLGAIAVAAAASLGLLLLVIDFLLNSLTDTGIGEIVVFHLKMGLQGMSIREFAGLIAFTILLLCAVITAGYVAYRLTWDRTGAGKAWSATLVGVAAVVAAYAVNPTVHDSIALARKYWNAPIHGVRAVAIPPEFAAIEEVNFAHGKKNLVLFYLESIERTYLDQERFPGLTPNLVALERDALSFTDVTQAAWSSWTIAGMIASQCAIPLAASGVGKDGFLPAATCIGDLLNSAGYETSYMGGASTEFAGKGEFYRSHGYSSVEGRAELLGQQDDPDYESLWGVYDDSLLDLAARRFDTLAAAETPFVLTLVTVDTHHPEGGIVSATCENVTYQDGSHAYLNAVHCADKMAGDFIRRILSSPAMDDTVLVVLSDHLARPNAVADILESGERRNLVFAFGSGIEPGLVNKPGVTIDIAPTVLGLLGVETEALNYGRDLLGPLPSLRSGERPLDQLFEEQWPFLASLWVSP